MPLSNDIKFQKALALAASASNPFEAEAAELAARRMMAAYNIDPTDIPDHSLYSRANFADNALLKRLRAEWREANPVVVEIVAEEVRSSDLGDFPTIPFNMNGFSRHAHGKRGRRPKAIVTYADKDKFRELFNAGFTVRMVATCTGFPRYTVNSTFVHIRKKSWVLDAKGLWQWARYPKR